MRLKAVLVCLLSGAGAAVVACGDDGGAHKLPDAPTVDGAPNPDTPDPAVPARLTITRDGSGVEGIDVFFQNADSSLVAKVPTDANGVAEATVMPNAFVTVVDPFLVATGVRQNDLRTIAGVQPGDHLVLTENFGRQVLTFMTVLANQDPNGSQYNLWSTCLPLDTKGGAPYGMGIGSGSDRPQANFDLINCGATTDILVESENGSGTGVGWTFTDNAPVVADGTIDIPTAYTATAFTNAAWSDIPSNITSLSTSTYIATSDGPLWRDGNALGIGSNSASWSFPRPAPAGSTQIFVDSMFGGTSYGQHQVIDWKPIADPPTFSFANTLLREFVDGPTFDFATHTVSWTETTTGVAPDLAISELTASRDDGVNTIAWRWQLAGVPAASTLVYPVLPTEIARFNVVTGDLTQVFDLTTAKVPGGYGTVRPVVLNGISIGLALGPSGRIVTQQYVGRVLREAPPVKHWQRAPSLSR